MDNNQFTEVVETRINAIRSVLVKKAEEYASDSDRLHNFKKAANLQDETPRQALMGMMSKHVVSVADMASGTDTYPMEMWEEKIGDNINYLILLMAIVQEEKDIEVNYNAEIRDYLKSEYLTPDDGETPEFKENRKLLDQIITEGNNTHSPGEALALRTYERAIRQVCEEHPSWYGSKIDHVARQRLTDEELIILKFN